MRATTVREIQQDGTLHREPCRMEMPPGHSVVCVQGLVWLTVESRDIELARRDVVLAVGDRFAASHAVVAFASALGRAPARIAVDRHAPGMAATAEALNRGNRFVASSSSMSA